MSVIAAPIGACSNGDEGDDGQETLVIDTSGGERVFQIEVARTPNQKSRGLMFRTQLDAGHGMLFPYDAPVDASMWMRNTYISLDMIFIAANGRVLRVAARTEPLSDTIVSAQGLVTGVLEIGGGEAERLTIRPGDMVRYEHFGKAPDSP